MEIAIIVVVLILVIWYICTYNFFKRQKEEIGQYKSGIDIALTNRYDVLTKMKESVKGYMTFEKETLTNVIAVRNNMSLKEMSECESQMQKAFDGINALAEQYPELKASENFLVLQQSIADTEENLQVCRRIYNSAVAEYNKKTVSFPSIIVASIHKVSKFDFFEAEEHKRKDVDMSF